MRDSGGRLQAVEYTRGVAAFMVMWFHFTYLLPDGVLRASGLYGYLGVEAFFVITGFIIPYPAPLPARQGQFCVHRPPHHPAGAALCDVGLVDPLRAVPG